MIKLEKRYKNNLKKSHESDTQAMRRRNRSKLENILGNKLNTKKESYCEVDSHINKRKQLGKNIEIIKKK